MRTVRDGRDTWLGVKSADRNSFVRKPQLQWMVGGTGAPRRIQRQPQPDAAEGICRNSAAALEQVSASDLKLRVGSPRQRCQ
jgi:hypothetical protein